MSKEISTMFLDDDEIIAYNYKEEYNNSK